MSSLHLSRLTLESGLRWIARLLAAVLVGLVIVIFIGNGFNPFRLKATEAIQMTWFFTACVGMVLAWRWQVIGGAISIAGMVFFFAVEFAVTGRLPKGLVFYLMFLPGIFFMLSGLIRWRMERTTRKMWGR